MIEPAIIVGQVMHHRLRPVANRFVYPIFCLRLPLSCLAQLPQLGIALNSWSWCSFYEHDYGPRDGSALKPWIAALLKEHAAADGEVVLYTFPRVLGYVFNPISFWLCHDKDSRPRAVLCEVNNTFGEHHHYLLAHSDQSVLQSNEELVTRKALHVSPFCRIEGQYRFRFNFAADRWLARIDYEDEQGLLLNTAISGNTQSLTVANLRRVLLRYPILTLGVISRIHFQALKLWLKKVPYFAKPEPPMNKMTR